ncbi:MAG: DoxX family protein [Actinomycetota bacterium]|nr:DoxX family protein [Actinomycetota bacterium]
MTLVRRVARPMLASVFITGGLDSLRNPAPKAPAAEPVTVPLARRIPYLPDDPEQLVKINAAVQVGAGALLALGKLPRLSALALAATLVPTTLAGHRFWEHEDPAQRAQHQIHFTKNVSMLGGLLLAAVDTEGRPGLGWRARHAGRTGAHALRAGRRELRMAARQAKLAAKAAPVRLAA